MAGVGVKGMRRAGLPLVLELASIVPAMSAIFAFSLSRSRLLCALTQLLDLR